MVSNQTEFNKNYSKELREIKIETEDYKEEQLIVEDYSNLERLYLHDVQDIEKIILKNLPNLQEVTVWDCSLQNLMIEKCSLIQKLNLRRNQLTNLNFINELNNLETLEIDGNEKLTELLKIYEGDWKDCQKDLKELNEDNQKLLLLIKVRILEKKNEFLNIKYDELKKFLKGVLISFSQEEKKELSNELDKKIQRRMSMSSSGMTRELMASTEKTIKIWNEIRKDLEKELTESKIKIEELNQKLSEQINLYQEKESELAGQRSLSEELKKQWIISLQEGAKSEPIDKEKWEQKSKELEAKLDEAKKREYNLEGELKAKREEIERMNKTIEKAVVAPKTQNINQTISGSSGINAIIGDENSLNQITYPISLDNKKLQKELNELKNKFKDLDSIENNSDPNQIKKSILFLIAKRMLANNRLETINKLIQTYQVANRSTSKYDKVALIGDYLSYGEELANLVPGGATAVKVFSKGLPTIVNLLKTKSFNKHIAKFEEYLIEDEKALILLEETHSSLSKGLDQTSQINSSISKMLNLEDNEFKQHSIFTITEIEQNFQLKEENIAKAVDLLKTHLKDFNQSLQSETKSCLEKLEILFANESGQQLQEEVEWLLNELIKNTSVNQQISELDVQKSPQSEEIQPNKSSDRKKNILLISVTDKGEKNLKELLKGQEDYEVIDIIGKAKKLEEIKEKIDEVYGTLCDNLAQILIIVDNKIIKEQVKIYYEIIEKFYGLEAERKKTFGKLGKLEKIKIDKRAIQSTTLVKTNFPNYDDWKQDIEKLKKQGGSVNSNSLIESLFEQGERFFYTNIYQIGSAVGEQERSVYERNNRTERERFLEYLRNKTTTINLRLKGKEEVLEAAIEIHSQLKSIK